MERGDGAHAIRHGRRGAERDRTAHAVALRADLAVLRDGRLLVEPRDERLRIGHVRRLVQRLRERHQLRESAWRRRSSAVGAFFTR